MSAMFGAVGASGVKFDPIRDIAWHAAYWPGGPAFALEAVSDGAQMGSGFTIPDEKNSFDIQYVSGLSNDANYDASDSLMNGEPSFKFTGPNVPVLAASFAGDVLSTTYSIAAVVYHDNSTPTHKEPVFQDYGHPGGYQGDGFGFNDDSGLEVYVQHPVGNDITRDVWPTAGVRGIAVVCNRNNRQLWVSGVQELSSSFGWVMGEDHEMGGVQMAGTEEGSAADTLLGNIGFLAVYDGDIIADDNWGKFQTWVNDRFGCTI